MSRSLRLETPTFADMRQRMERVWLESSDCQEYVQWAGIFGSIARGRARNESDVDVLVVFKDHIRCGEPIDLHEGVCVFFQMHSSANHEFKGSLF